MPRGELLLWVKGHKKLVIILSLVLVVALVLAIALPVGLANKDNGTYYAYSFEQFNENEYYKLDGGKWTNASGEKGTYEISGDKITIYQEIFGSNMKLASGTLKDGILTLSIGGAEMKYAMKGAVHVHEYEEWTVVTPSMCMRQGTEQGKCKCGETKTRSLPLAEHKPKNEWGMDEEQHWQICSVCGQAINKKAHTFGEDFCSLCGLPAKETTGLEFREDGDGYIVTGLGSATGPIIRIPAQYDGLPVTSIGNKAFYNCDGLTSITIPDSVISIGEEAFSSCGKLTSVTIGSGVTSIGERAFRDCSNLTSVHITDLSAWCRIDFAECSASPLLYAHHLFLDGTEVTKVTFSADITEIKDYVFRGGSALTSVVIGQNVTSIGNNAFRRCSALTDVIIGRDVTLIKEEAFYECSVLKNITYQGTVDEWLAIEKEKKWDRDTVNYTVTCTDGTVSKYGTVTRK